MKRFWVMLVIGLFLLICSGSVFAFSLDASNKVEEVDKIDASKFDFKLKVETNLVKSSKDLFVQNYSFNKLLETKKGVYLIQVTQPVAFNPTLYKNCLKKNIANNIAKIGVNG